MHKILFKHIKEWTVAIAIAMLIAGFIRIFLLQGFFVPSQSMEPSLMAGDFIFISKYHYGARMPITPLSIPFMHQNMPFTQNRKAYSEAIQLPYYRFWGFSEIKRHDVLVFNYPMESERPIDKRSYYVKRCIALPGETLEIVGKKVHINQQWIKEPVQVQINRKLRSSKELDEVWMDSVGISEGGKLSNLNDYLFPLTDTLSAQLSKTNYITGIEPLMSKKGDYQSHIFPHNELLPFNTDYFGPVITPFAGMEIKLNDTTSSLYKRIIETYEEHEFSYAGGHFYIDGKQQESYIFQHNYYFVLGDNRDQSADSRFWGFVPESHIVGKAIFIGFSYNKFSDETLKIRWNRVFKSIK
jgi:signal peptidase I